MEKPGAEHPAEHERLLGAQVSNLNIVLLPLALNPQSLSFGTFNNHWCTLYGCRFPHHHIFTNLILVICVTKEHILSQNHWSRRVRRGVRLSEGRHREDVRHEGEN